jgi:hypothetical protein
MTFKEYILSILKKKKKDTLPQSDKSHLVNSKDVQSTQQLPASSPVQPSLS